MQKDPGFGRLIFLIIAGAFSLLLLVVSAYQLYDFTESTAFCGKLCHTVMYPEYTTYQESPHSRVRCADCHVGPGANYLVQSKIAGIPMIFGTLTGNYPKPLQSPVENLRPARDTCEECHWPEMFSGDLLIKKTHFAQDENNTQTDITRFLDLGGGQSDTAKGIHWHITNEMEYISLDAKRTDIAWVQTVDESGTTVTYVNPDKAQQITPELIKNKKRLMDCVDCHNRASHIFYSPNQLLDQSMAEGKIDKTLPYLKREALKILDPPSSSLAAANTKIEAIRNFYQTNYPAVSTNKQPQINTAVDQLKEIAVLTTFPHMQVDYNTHLDFSDHQNGSGCFRCHGKLAESSGPNTGQIISADCNLCHTMVSPGDIPGKAIPHSLEGRQDCLACHGLESKTKPFPTDHAAYPVSSCTSCHAVEPSTTPPNTKPAPNIPHGILNIANCLDCHSRDKSIPFPVDHANYDINNCTTCHPVQAVGASSIPHAVSNLTDCVNCHGVSGKNNLPSNHQGWPDSFCTLCHVSTPISTPTIPHVSSGPGANCLNCHGAGNFSVPANHSKLDNSKCSLCHRVNLQSARNIPHALTGRSDCLSCHSSGSLAVPASHNSYVNNFCTLCHAVKIQSGPSIPHLTSGAGSSCLSCHGVTQTIGAGHSSYSSSVCASCHTVSRISAPRLPHSVRDDCLRCHSGNVPGSHSRYTNNSCSLCHTR